MLCKEVKFDKAVRAQNPLWQVIANPNIADNNNTGNFNVCFL